jgi:Tol biopolymer transport system component
MKAARILAITAVLLCATRLDAQQYFGMNQVQYRHFDWKVIETEHWQVHYYPEERQGAMDAARMAERSYARLSRVLDHQFREKKPIILFASRAEFGQNNVTGDLGEGVGGVTDYARDRMILPLTGDLGSFEHVLTHEMVHEFQYDIFSRGKAGANVQTLNQVNPPDWFMEGMAEYLSIGPDHKLTTTWLRDAAVNGNLPTIEQMTERPDKYFPYRYGEALWEYVGERWGDAAIGEILQNVTTLGVARAFQRQLGLTLHELSDEWREAVNAKYLPQAAVLDRARSFSQPLLTEKKSGGQIFLAPSLSPDGSRIAFLSNGNEKKAELFIDLWLADARTGKRIKRLVESTTNPNFEELRLLYSQSAFSNDGRSLAFTAQREGKDVMYIIDVASASVKRRVDLPSVDAIWSPTWSPDDRQIAFSGTHGGITDLYIVDTDGKNLRQLTNDQYGDLQPAWSPDGNRIAFATDRGPETDLSILKFSKWRIAVMDIKTGTIDVLPNQGGLNLNPVWSPDGRQLAFVSDRTGVPNIFLFDFTDRQHYQLTNVLGGVSAITEYSPAISWARQADKIAYTNFEKGDYTVWTIDNPRALKKTAFNPNAATVVATNTVADTSASRDSLVLHPRPGEPTSTYRAAAGTRQSSVLPSGEAAQDLSPTIAVMMTDPLYGLPDTTRFREHPYHATFHPDYIADPSIGYTPNYGTFSGGTAFVFSDLLGNHQLAVAGNVYGRLSDASAFVGYADLSHRLQYSTGLSQDPVYVPFTGGTSSPAPGIVRLTNTYLRYVVRNVFLTGQYPFNRFSRVETGVQFNSIAESFVNIYQDCEQATGFCTDVQFSTDKKNPLPTYNYATPSVAFVSDNTLFGNTGPVIGRRMRFQVGQNLGGINFTDILADYRRYDPIIFNTLTFATRFMTSVSRGPDEDFFPKYIGRPDFVRGYDRENFNFVDCTAIIGGAQSTCANQQLAGSRVAVFNEELRFPIIRRFDVGSSFGLPPVDGLIFYDAGLAWSKGMTPHLGNAPKGNDPNLDRYPLASWGAGLRVNVFNLAILRWDYARPLVGGRKPNWTFSLGASY